MFIDEFQDTNPIQTQMVKWFASENTMIGVIGDEEQAIYGFQGAKYEDFKDFSLSGHIDYKIEHNRRSTGNIVRLLNHIRGDGLEQTCLREIDGSQVCCLVGQFEASIHRIDELLGSKNNELYILARKNEQVLLFRKMVNNSGDNTDLWENFEKIDNDRYLLFDRIIRAVELIHQGYYPNGIKELHKQIVRSTKGNVPLIKISRKLTDQEFRGITISFIEILLTQYNQLYNEPLLTIYKYINDFLSKVDSVCKLKGVSRGGFKDYAESNLYKDLAITIQLHDEVRKIRTIHKAKSAEFKNVLLCLSNDGDTDSLEFLLNPQTFIKEKDKEEKRIVYVALSRAKDNLFIHLPDLKQDKEEQLKNMNLEIIRV